MALKKTIRRVPTSDPPTGRGIFACIASAADEYTCMTARWVWGRCDPS